ncbi:hypothetical protein [Levilactobacillus brevis]|uniref:hypothetical protein n=1 Tax=Levilactobacillus brevis TaxID=1580 RepID=UPI0005B51E8F|nr:hypothetical protein [Levilactobacillus brevis]
MIKLTENHVTAFMLLRTVVAVETSMGNPTVSAKAKQPTASQMAATHAKIAANEEKVDKSLDKIDINSLSDLDAIYTYGAVSSNPYCTIL